ncbi:GNAT family N-acetyltransferase [Kineococcus sp. NPDC059986]|uniref:GNAT family N-acetyltransferase n=1 Tax=Kineococcus sp. NPDC059986 TaxID=3155538 RepID=UPI00344F8626
MEPEAVVLDTAELVDAACALYREVLAAGEPGVELNPRLLAALGRNGGSVVGLREEDRLVAFAYGFPARDGSGEYHWSQSAAVAADAQGRGLGRRLKQAQADVVRATGTHRMRWAFDPGKGRNAHFNLDVLGARGRWYVDDFYRRPGTDRVVVEWDLAPDGGAPAGPTEVVARLEVTPDGPPREEFHRLLDDGFVAVTCARADGGAVWGFARAGESS